MKLIKLGALYRDDQGRVGRCVAIDPCTVRIDPETGDEADRYWIAHERLVGELREGDTPGREVSLEELRDLAIGAVSALYEAACARRDAQA